MGPVTSVSCSIGGRGIDENVGARLDGALVECAGRHERGIAAESAAHWWAPGLWGCIRTTSGGSSPGDSGLSAAVAVERVGASAAVQVVFHVLCAVEGPFVFVAPLVLRP